MFERVKQTEPDWRRRQQLRLCLQSLFQRVLPMVSVHLVGSSSNGFGSAFADADVCLMLTSDICNRSSCLSLLRLCQRTLRKIRVIRNPTVIRAKVPILRFTDTVCGLSVDLNINNAPGIQNTQLLSAYSTKDERVKPLGIAVKVWAKANDINNASQQTLSSYSLIIMLLHYLQCACNPPVIPVLDPGNYRSWSQPWVSANTDNLGLLFARFMRYYAEQFDYEGSVISIRLGKALSRNEMRFPRSRGNLMCIEEPFEQTNVAHCVFNVNKFNLIRAVFERSWRVLRKTRRLTLIMPVQLQ